MAKKANSDGKVVQITVPTQPSGQYIAQKPGNFERTVTHADPMPPKKSFTFHGDGRIKINDATLKPR